MSFETEDEHESVASGETEALRSVTDEHERPEEDYSEEEAPQRSRIAPLLGAFAGVILLLAVAGTFVYQKFLTNKPARVQTDSFNAGAPAQQPVPPATAAYPDPAGFAGPKAGDTQGTAMSAQQPANGQPQVDAAGVGSVSPAAGAGQPASVAPQVTAAPSIAVEPHVDAKPKVGDLKQTSGATATTQTQTDQGQKGVEDSKTVVKLVERVSALEAEVSALKQARAASTARQASTAISRSPEAKQSSDVQKKAPKGAAKQGASQGSSDRWIGAKLEAIVPGQAWIEVDGDRKTVHVGNEVAGAKVVSIDAEKGRVVTTKGVIEFE